MQTGKFNIIIDQAWGSSGKGKVSTWLVDHYNVMNVSSSNYPNAGHSFLDKEYKFIAKAISTAAGLKHTKGIDINCWMSPGSGFSWFQFIKEWRETDKPTINVHSRASIVTEDHARREREGLESTKHIASTMQGTATAMVDKILRKSDCLLAGNYSSGDFNDLIQDPEFLEKIKILDGMDFRQRVQGIIKSGQTWMHEGSQGYALSIDHGSHYPSCTSRNCSTQKAMDDMAIAPQLIGDVYLNLRTYPIRVGNVIENGERKGYSGDFYPDCEELTWEEVGVRAKMPIEEITKLRETEKTTVTKRLRRVATFSWIGLKDAVETNGATKLCVNFIQYISWADSKLKGGREAFEKLSKESRAFIDKVEEVAQVPVVLIGTGADHSEMISLL